MIDNSIKVGFCVAYDWYFLKEALPLVYDDANVIWLSIDEDHSSWTNQSFDWDEAEFTEWVRKIDKVGKINICKDNFHLAHLTAIQNEVRQRNMMAEKMGQGGWHIQLDCDEYFVDFKKFVEYLRHLPDYPYAYNVACPFVTLFKKQNGGFLYIYPKKNPQIEHFQIATRYPAYEHGRRNGHFNMYSDFLIIHQSWARTESEIKQKVANWGHVDDFDVHGYFDFWRSVSATNYQRFINFHPIQPSSWPSLRFVKGESIIDLIPQFREKGFPTLSPVRLFLKNSRLLAKVLRLLRLLT